MHAAGCRYDNALNKANVASLVLQQPAEAADDFADDADDDLQASLARARRAAQLKAATSTPSVEDVAAEATRRREAHERAALDTGVPPTALFAPELPALTRPYSFTP